MCGDFGYWHDTDIERNNLDWLESQPWTTLFVDGNHSNFDRLKKLSVEEWNGGKVHKIRPHIIHLMRGQVFTINGKTFFTFGGAQSHDISDGILETDDPRIAEWQYDYCKMFRINPVSYTHLHHYWKGERGSSHRKLILKWLAPIFIKGYDVNDNVVTTNVFLKENGKV